LHHAIELDRRYCGEPARSCLAHELIGQRTIAGEQQIGAEQQIRLPRQRALDSIGEKTDGADARPRADQRGDQDAQLAGAPVAR
jgi:hypothetical protein